MEKVLEALEELESLHNQALGNGSLRDKYADEEYETIKQVLLELKAIKEAKPSEALECLKELGQFELKDDSLVENFLVYDTIEQALIEAQSNEKWLKTISNHLSFKDVGIETYDNQTKYLVEIESKDTGATIHIHLNEEEEEFDY